MRPLYKYCLVLHSGYPESNDFIGSFSGHYSSTFTNPPPVRVTAEEMGSAAVALIFGKQKAAGDQK